MVDWFGIVVVVADVNVRLVAVFVVEVVAIKIIHGTSWLILDAVKFYGRNMMKSDSCYCWVVMSEDYHFFVLGCGVLLERAF